jgi:putative membrane protein
MFLDKIPLVSPDYSRPANSLRSRIAVELEPFLSAKALLTTLVLILTPALCVWMYLSSVWDPYGNLAHLPAAIVNQDAPVAQAGRQINLGGDILATLEKEKPFAFVRYPTPNAARAAVQSGRAFFALLIPADFSQRSVAAERPAQLVLYVSADGNSTASLLAQRFGTDLAHSLNEQLNRERWTTWAGEPGRGGVSTLGSGLVALQTGSKQLVAHTRRVHAGSAELRQGLLKSVRDAQDLKENADQVVDKSFPVIEGIKQTSVAIAGLRATLPEQSTIAALAPLSESVLHASADLKQSLEQVKPDMVQLGAAVTQLQTSTARVIFVGGRLSAEAARVHSGVTVLGAAIEKGSEQAGQLNDNATLLNAAIPPLVNGFTGVEKGFILIDQKLPTTDHLDGFSHAVARLHDSDDTVKVGLTGASQRLSILDDSNGTLEKEAAELSAGLEEAVTRFQAGSNGNHAGQLATPVETMVEAGGTLPRNGPALAPYFAAIFLWVGAVLLNFISELRRQPSANRRAWRLTRWFVKVSPLLVLGAFQATAVIVVFRMMGLVLANPPLVWAMAILGSLTFVTVTTLFTLVLDNFGRLLGVLLLGLQLAASAGVYPVELSPAFYQNVHGWLPLTFLVRAFRTSMFSTSGSQWFFSAQALVIFGAIAVLLGILLARWKYVVRETRSVSPEVDRRGGE